MKRWIPILFSIVFAVFLFSGCDLMEAKEGQITFSLEEERESERTWVYFVEPQGMIEKVRDEIYASDSGLTHEWIFEGIEEGEVGITFQYSQEGEDPIRTIHYSCFVDENLHVSLIETEDSASAVGVEDEALLQCISAALSLQFEEKMEYPSGKVSQEYAQAFLNCYVNLFCSERAEAYDEITGTDFEQYIALDEETVSEILSIAFGSRFGTDVLSVDNNAIIFNAHSYYFGVRDYAWADVIPSEEMQYIFTVMGETESVDGIASVTVKETSQNRVGLSLTDITAQKSE